MCGIAAILLYPQERPEEIWQEIKSVFTQNLIFNEDRGRDATGLAILQRNGTMEMLKQAQPASEVVKNEQYKHMLEHIGKDTTLILGHTRLPTKGSVESDNNNHPIQAGNVFGVHNGTIKNDDLLFEQCACPRNGEVDSEIIFRLLEPISAEEQNEKYLQAIRPEILRMDGAYTFLSSDQRAPEKLLVVKHNNPLCIHFHKEWNALIFSSRYIFLRKAFGKAVVTEALPHDQLLLYNAFSLPEWGNQPPESLMLFSN